MLYGITYNKCWRSADDLIFLKEKSGARFGTLLDRGKMQVYIQ